MAFPTIVFGPSYGWIRAREVASLAQPEPSELDTLAPGTRMLIVSQVPPDAPPGPHGLALFYVEARQQDNATQDGKQNASTNRSSAWKMETPPQRTEILLTNGKPLSVQFSAKTNFLNAQQFEEGLEGSGDEKGERRYVGYLPGQTLAVEGAWEGNGLLTVRSCYAGTPDEYAASLARQALAHAPDGPHMRRAGNQPVGDRVCSAATGYVSRHATATQPARRMVRDSTGGLEG